MPELPEVETSRRGISPHLVNQTIEKLIVRNGKLRWPVPRNLAKKVTGRRITAIDRRAKYLLIRLDSGEGGTLVVHLGMSGSLRVVTGSEPHGSHDHVDLMCANGKVLRFNDPRRFGAWLWYDEADEDYELLNHLGPEPLTDEFNGDYLFAQSRKKKQPVKHFIMSGPVVVGVGNIYANEALFMAGIRPTRQAGRLTRQNCQQLVAHIKTVLTHTIEQGGTTLKDFVGSDGKPGYFKQELRVYGRQGESYVQCEATLKEIRMANRSSVYCPSCQS